MTTTTQPERRADDQRISELVQAVTVLLEASKEHGKAWRFEKQISVGNLLTMLVMCGTVFGAWSTLNNRVTTLETVVAAQPKIDEKQERQAEIGRLEIRAELDKINIKLDRLNERKQ